MALRSADSRLRRSGVPQGQPGLGRRAAHAPCGQFTEAAVDAALAGLGIIRVLSYQVVDELRFGSLQSILEEFVPEPMPVSLVYPHAGLLPLKTRAFLNWTTPRLRARLQAISIDAGEEGRANDEPAARAARPVPWPSKWRAAASHALPKPAAGSPQLTWPRAADIQTRCSSLRGCR